MQQPLRLACLVAILFGTLLIGGCTTLAALLPSTTEAIPATTRAAATPAYGGFDWDWDVRGDQAVRPIQVFSDGNKTWLQFGQRQYMPAVIVNGVPVPFDVAPPYLIVQGQPGRIDLMVAGYRATAVKRAQANSTAWTHTGGAKVAWEAPWPDAAVPLHTPAITRAVAPVSTSALPAGTSSLPAGTSSLPAGTSSLPFATSYPSARAGVPSLPAAAAVGSRVQRIPSTEIPSQ